MTRFPLTILAKLLAGLLLLIVIRALAEVFRLEYAGVDPILYTAVRPFVAGALAAVLALAATLLAIQFSRPGLAITLACIAIAALFVYRVYFVV